MQRMGAMGPGGQGLAQMQQQRMAMGNHPDQQIQKRIYQDLSNEPPQTGWKAEFHVQRRVVFIFQM